MMPGGGKEAELLGDICECFSAIEAALIGTVPRLAEENPVVNLWGHPCNRSNPR